ncbi:26S proteasome regulatory subunit N5, partial [Clonorchis sinensis]
TQLRLFFACPEVLVLRVTRRYRSPVTLGLLALSRFFEHTGGTRMLKSMIPPRFLLAKHPVMQASYKITRYNENLRNRLFIRLPFLPFSMSEYIIGFGLSGHNLANAHSSHSHMARPECIEFIPSSHTIFTRTPLIFLEMEQHRLTTILRCCGHPKLSDISGRSITAMFMLRAVIEPEYDAAMTVPRITYTVRLLARSSTLIYFLAGVGRFQSIVGYLLFGVDRDALKPPGSDTVDHFVIVMISANERLVMGDGRIEKMEIDFSSAVDALIPTVKAIASASDAISTGRLLEVMVEILGDAGKWEQLNRHLEAMTKKRNQLKQIYVEVERARLTRELARIKESHGNIDEAASVLQELQVNRPVFSSKIQVETYGSMEKKEKVEFMLEQIRLGLAKKDYIRTQIISRKISPKFFNDETHEQLKLKYYHLMIELNSHDDQYLNISKHYWEVYNTKSIQEDEHKRLLVKYLLVIIFCCQALKHVVAYLLLATFDNEQHDLMCRRKLVKEMERIPAYLEMLKAFTTPELLRWDEFCARYETILRTETDVFSKEKSPEKAEKRWNDLHSRLIERNIRVIAGYYTKLRLQRLAQLLDLDIEQAEKYLSELVVGKTITAKIDRLEGIVHFTVPKTPTEILNDWSYNTKCLMTLINQATHLINKERVLHSM